MEIFEPTIQKTNELLKDIEEYFGWTQKHQAYSAFKTVLHALRDRLTVNQAASLGAQLPMLVRGFYYDGWNPSAAPNKMDKAEFISRVADEFNMTGEPEALIKGVLAVLKIHIDPAEMEKIKSELPEDLRDLIP